MSVLVKIGLLALLGLQTAGATALDDYVWKPDENYKWVDMGPDHSFTSEVDKRPYTAYVLNMTSQRWLTDQDFSASSESGSIWWHYLVVIVPDKIKYTRNASIWITGGGMGMGVPKAGDEDVVVTAALATNLGTVAGVLYQIPNEHTTFSADAKQQSRTEDAIIAFTWDHFLNDPSQPEWLLRFPMVKASLRAMDTITEFTKQKRPELGTSLDYYMVSGASKRGWTTWDVGAVDRNRVKAIVPVVLDAINFVTVEHHEYRSYGGWSYALIDYVEMNITERFDDPNMVHLQENVDPYWYVDRLTMPKLIVNAGMDEFQQPDDNFYWWDKMPEPKHVMMIPNAEHSLITGILEAVPAIGAWGRALLGQERVPTFSWEIDSTTGDITATVDNDGKVHSATMWWAHSCGENAWDNNTKRRDYRIAHLDNPCTCGPYIAGYCINLKTFWQKQELTATKVHGKNVYKAHMDTPTDGSFIAFFIDFKFDSKHRAEDGINLDNVMKSIVRKPKGKDEKKTVQEIYQEQVKEVFPNFGGFPHDFGGFFEFTTQVSVIPNTFPYPDCSGTGCGDLIL